MLKSSQKNVIITRSNAENLILIEQINKIGLMPILCPMASHYFIKCDFAKFKNYRNIIVTSKFAAQIIAEHYPYNSLLHVVGEESAQILRKNKQLDICGIYNSVLDLVESIKGKIKGNILYLSGQYITMDIDFADRYVIYKTDYSTSIPLDVMDIIEKKGCHFMMFYSKNTAQNFINILDKHNGLQNLQNSVVISISKEVGMLFEKYVSNIFFPLSPNASEMLKLLEKHK